jgi:predicted AlkP superfamily pyrophosphatase or phosphodiesterase
MRTAGPLHMVVLIDGLGWQLLEGRDFLSDLLPHRRPVRTILGYSSGAIPTILTGRPPSEHGHWNLLYRDREGSPFRWLRPFGTVVDHVLDNRVGRKLLKELGRRAFGLGPLFECCVAPSLLPSFNWVERRNIYKPGGVSGTPSIFDRLTEASISYRAYSYHEWTDAEILAKAKHDLESHQARFLFLYLSELDAYLHAHIGDEKLVSDRLAWYESQLARLFHAARTVDPEVRLTLVSDHGMTPVRDHYDLVGEVEALGHVMPRDYLAAYDSTMARFWFSSDRARADILTHLASVPAGRILSDDELSRLGILFPDRRYGQVVFLLKPGWLFARSAFNGHGWRPAGMHGYDPDDPSSHAVFLDNQVPALSIAEMADLYALIDPTLD